MKTLPPEQTNQPVQEVPHVSLPRPSLTSIRERQALDTLINVGLLIDKKIDFIGDTVYRYYDPKGELLLTKHITQWGTIYYEAYKVGRAEFTDDLNYDQIPRLLVATTTLDRINLELYIPGAWETRLTKLAEGKLHGEISPKIQKSPRATKARSKD